MTLGHDHPQAVEELQQRVNQSQQKLKKTELLLKQLERQVVHSLVAKRDGASSAEQLQVSVSAISKQCLPAYVYTGSWMTHHVLGLPMFLHGMLSWLTTAPTLVSLGVQ